MKKRALVAVIIAAIAMMIGAQSTVVGQGAPGAFTAQGKVTHFGINLDEFPLAPAAPKGGPTTPNARGPWQVAVNLNTQHVSFNAICQVEGAVYKVSYTGVPDEEIEGLGTRPVTITVPYVTVEGEGTIWTSNPGTTITIDDRDPSPLLARLVVDIHGNGHQNVFGRINHFRVVPPSSINP